MHCAGWFWSCVYTGTLNSTLILFPSEFRLLVLYSLLRSYPLIYTSSSYLLHSQEPLCLARVGTRRFDRRCTILTEGRNNYISGICRRIKVRSTKSILKEKRIFCCFYSVGSVKASFIIRPI